MLTAVPDPPRLAALPADFGTAEAVAAAYLAAWCYQPAEQAANTNLRTAAPWMTAAGWADDSVPRGRRTHLGPHPGRRGEHGLRTGHGIGVTAGPDHADREVGGGVGAAGPGRGAAR